MAVAKIDGVKISGVVELAANETPDEFLDSFIAWIEARGSFFGGGVEGIDLDIDPNERAEGELETARMTK